MSIVITSFYDFFHIDNLEEIKISLLDFCNKNLLKGTILIAEEGINTTISGKRENIDSFYNFIETLFNKEFFYKENFDSKFPFDRMKVKIKPEIVTIGIHTINVEKDRGDYINPENWDEFISDPDVLLIDTRNNYEVNLGSFSGAINPNIDNFRQLPAWLDNNVNLYKDKKIAMVCTAGIRCEKSTSYLKAQGYNEVYHLKGGIVEYFKSTQNKNNKWYGNCFVFDDRISIDPNLIPQGDIYCSYCSIKIITNDIKKNRNFDEIICSKCLDDS